MAQIHSFPTLNNIDVFHFPSHGRGGQLWPEELSHHWMENNENKCIYNSPKMILSLFQSSMLSLPFSVRKKNPGKSCRAQSNLDSALGKKQRRSWRGTVVHYVFAINLYMYIYWPVLEGVSDIGHAWLVFPLMPVLEAKSCSNQTYPVILVLETKPKRLFWKHLETKRLWPRKSKAHHWQAAKIRGHLDSKHGFIWF